MAQVTSTGLSIVYDDLGQGEPALLMMPGWCSNRTVFQALAPRCNLHRRTLVLDWRGHGESEQPADDFGNNDLVEDALAVIQASGAQQVVPVAHAHAGWVAIELRRRLGALIPKLVLLDWLILEAPPPFLEALQGMQSPAQWQQTVEQIFSLWLHGVDDPKLIRFVREEMGAYGFAMWSRAAREIGTAYAQAGSPLQALAALETAVPVLHLYAQPEDSGYLTAQQSFAAVHPWFSVHKLHACSHFPMLEVPDEMAVALEGFVTGTGYA
jgi:pimeloyl-ACP methyl ester carboxylesterase